METDYELYVKQNNRWILEANFQTHQREEALEEAKQLGRQGHIQAVKVVREQRNPKSGLTRETTIYSTDKSKSRRGDDDDEDGEGGSSDPFDDGGGGGGGGERGGGARRSPADDDDDDFGGPDLGASASATRAYGSNFADMEVEIGGGGRGGGTDWADMEIPSLDQIETHAKKVRRVPVAVPRAIPSGNTAAAPMGPATIALVKLFIVLALSIAIAAAVTFMFQRMGLGGR